MEGLSLKKILELKKLLDRLPPRLKEVKLSQHVYDLVRLELEKGQTRSELLTYVKISMEGHYPQWMVTLHYSDGTMTLCVIENLHPLLADTSRFPTKSRNS